MPEMLILIKDTIIVKNTASLIVSISLFSKLEIRNTCFNTEDFQIYGYKFCHRNRQYFTIFEDRKINEILLDKHVSFLNQIAIQDYFWTN